MAAELKAGITFRPVPQSRVRAPRLSSTALKLPFTVLRLEPNLSQGGVFHFAASEAIRGSVLQLIRLVFSHFVGPYLLYWHNCGVVTNSRQPTPTWPGFPAILQRRTPGFLQNYPEWTHPLHAHKAAWVQCPAKPLKSPEQYLREVLLHAGVGKK